MFATGGGSAAYAVTCPENTLARRITSILPALELACCGLLAGLLLWKGILPGWRSLHTDFPNYYLVARLLREGYTLDRIYDWVWLQRIKDHWGLDQPLVGFAGLTPFSALPIVPFSFFSALLAKRLWMIFNLLCLATSIELFRRVTSLGRRRLWLLSLLAVFPLRTSFLLGQMHLLVLLLIALAYYFHRRGRVVASAICLSIAGSLKIYPLCFGFYFLWKKQWRSAVAMLGSSLFLLGFGYLWFGRDAMNVYLIQVLPRSLQGEVLNPYSAQAASMAALFHRLFIVEPSLNPSPLWRAPGLYALLYPLWQLLILMPLFLLIQEKCKHADAEPLEWAAVVLALLVLSPVPASYHFVALIFSMVLLVEHLVVKRRFGVLVVAVVLYCAISVIEWVPATHRASSTALIAFGRLWIEFVLLAVFFVCLRQVHTRRQTVPIDRYRIAWLSGVAVVLWVAGALGYYHHFKYLQANSSARLSPAPDAYLSTGVRYEPGGYLFVAMTGDRYRVLGQNGEAIWKGPAGHELTDQLSVALAQSQHSVVVELADRNGSQLYVIASAAEPKAPWMSAPLIANAESPALSANGTTVAFIREVKGRGTLWLARLQQSLGRLRGEPTPLTSSTYDVRDVTFTTSGRLLFTARVDGHTSIYSLNPSRQPRILLSEREDVDAPAISPDERRIAFRKLIAGRWQLGYLDAASGREWMLTTGDCNAYSPAWVAPAVIAYATDCGRGLGLSALASIDVGRRFTLRESSMGRLLVSTRPQNDTLREAFSIISAGPGATTRSSRNARLAPRVSRRTRFLVHSLATGQ